MSDHHDTLNHKEAREWLVAFENTIHSYLHRGKVTYKYSVPTRTTLGLCTPLLCVSCLTWSTFFRLIACPFNMCLRRKKLLQAACDDNICTFVTDECIESYLSEVFAHKMLPVIPQNLRALLTESERARFLQALEVLEIIFTVEDDHQYMAHHYLLSEALFMNTYGNQRTIPERTIQIIAELREKLEDQEPHAFQDLPHSEMYIEPRFIF